MKVIDFIFAARPMLLLPVWSVYIISTVTTNKILMQIDYTDLVVLLGATLLFSGAYYINQIFDYESDLINKKLGFLQKGMMKRSEMMAAYISVSIIGLIFGFWVSYKSGIVLSLIFVLGYIYSASPFRFKDRPIGGLLTNAIAYGFLIPLAVPVFWNRIEFTLFYLPGYFFLAIAAGYILTIIPDRDGDIKTGKKTLAAYLPDRILILIGIIILLLSLLAAYALQQYLLLGISGISLILYLIAMVTKKQQLILFACKLPILLMSILAGYYYPVYLIFLIVLLVATRLYYKKRFGIIYPRFG